MKVASGFHLNFGKNPNNNISQSIIIIVGFAEVELLTGGGLEIGQQFKSVCELPGKAHSAISMNTPGPSVTTHS